MKFLYKLTFGLALVLGQMVSSVQAQQQKVDTSSAVTSLANRLSISREQAAKLHSIFNYRSEEMKQIMQNPTLKPEEKQERLRMLHALRRHKIDSALTPELKARYSRTRPADAVQQAASFQRSVEQRHSLSLAKVPHHHIQRSDSSSTEQKLQPKLPKS